MEELKRELRRYEDSRPYVAIRDRHTDPDPAVWVYRAKLTQKPSDDIPLIIGDIVHNLRASLDHVVVGLAPTDRKRRARFPIIRQDIWRTDPDTGEYVDGSEDVRQARKSYSSALKDIPAKARKIVDLIQPAKSTESSTWLNELHSLDLADKHYSLLAVPEGIDITEIQLVSRRYEMNLRLTGSGFALNGAVVTTLPRHLEALTMDRASIDRVLAVLAADAKVDVQLTGTPKVALEVPGAAWKFKVPEALDDMLSQTWNLTEALSWQIPKVTS